MRFMLLFCLVPVDRIMRNGAAVSVIESCFGNIKPVTFRGDIIGYEAPHDLKQQRLICFRQVIYHLIQLFSYW